jgi:proteasome accessory factor B
MSRQARCSIIADTKPGNGRFIDQSHTGPATGVGRHGTTPDSRHFRCGGRCVTRRAASSPKIQRWIDLIAALLLRHYPVTFEELTAKVPAYQATEREDARRRAFERDKDELRDYGIPIETKRDPNGEVIGYLLDRRQFYLPYLSLPGQPAPKRKTAKPGYRDLPSLAFDPDELAAVADAAALVRNLGDPLLADAASSAMRKFAFDLPVDSVWGDDEPHIVRPRREPDGEVFDRLTNALERRKLVSFAYHAMGRDETRRRTVEPWGLFFIGQHWYLAGRDTDANGLRNFRLSRMSEVEMNTKRAQSADFAIPADFRLRDHARSREAWALGEAGVLEAIVELHGRPGAVRAAEQLGAPVEGHPNRRRFEVRRLDAFARWMLSFGGDLEPVEPLELVNAFRDLVKRTAAVYRTGAANG